MALVKELNIREMRASLGQLAELVATEGELVICRRGERDGCPASHCDG